MPAPDQFTDDTLVQLMATATVQVVLGYKNTATDWDFQRLPLYDGLQEDFRARAAAGATEIGTRSGRPYDPEWDLKPDEYFYLSNDPPVGGNFFSKLPNFAVLPEFKEKKRIRNPNVWVVIAQLDDKTLAYFGARITASSVLDRAGRALRIVFRDQAFDALDETVITFKPDFDWIAWQGDMVVLNAPNFHALFRDIPALLAAVDAHVKAIDQHIGIANLAEFAARIGATPAMAVKLARIIERGDMHTRSAAELKQYGVDYSIEVGWQDGKMVFDGSVARQWNILRLLDEANTLGPVTGNKYETASKVAI